MEMFLRMKSIDIMAKRLRKSLFFTSNLKDRTAVITKNRIYWTGIYLIRGIIGINAIKYDIIFTIFLICMISILP